MCGGGSRRCDPAGVGHDGWGIEEGWHGTDGAWHPTPEGTRRALRDAMGGDADAEDPPPHRPAWVVHPGGAEPLNGPCRLTLEDGTDLGEVTALPPDLPLGYHRLDPADGWLSTHLICSPGRCHLPDGLRDWGVTVQVPTTRSRRSWGIGDLTDLAAVARWAREAGAGFLGLSPLHAPRPGPEPQASPYYPSSRRWRSPLLVDVEAVPGADRVPSLAEHATAARALRAAPVVDRAAVWSHQHAVLSEVWAATGPAGHPAFDAWRAEQGPDLEAWATYAALAEVHGADWSSWPAGLRRPDGSAVATAARDLAGRVAFHAWLQWLVATQLGRVVDEGVRLVHDLAIGADPAGFDAWWWQDLLMTGARVGAPPDAFAAGGQDWGLPPFRPWALRDAGYQPLAGLLRAAMAAGGGLRVDHVMGLTRLFCIPEGAEPAEGTYVRYAGRELLEVVALESHRAGAVVVGEDLGTVEPGFREVLGELGILSTRLALFEDDPPEHWPAQALAMVTTHDLPTLAGLWDGGDDAELDALGRAPDPDEAAQVRDRIARLVGEGSATAAGVAEAVHGRLAASPAALVAATLEDLVGVVERPNVPGTTDERPNWSLALPVDVEDLPDHPLATRITTAMAAARRPARGGL
jgi:4-alpha-glucanotransferase